MIKSVLVFANGMCAVFDENGQQMTELQGKWEHSRKEIYTILSTQDEDAFIELHSDWMKFGSNRTKEPAKDE